MGYEIRDELLKKTKALPNGAASVTSDPIDLETGSRSDFVANCELLLSAPALATGELGDGATMKYAIETDDNSGFSSATTLIVDAIVQTGAGGAGAAAATKRFTLPTNVERYVRAKATNSAAGNASGKSLTLEVLL